jgi:hypothetical protein
MTAKPGLRRGVVSEVLGVAAHFSLLTDTLYAEG